jgi:hypothetical protein
VDPQSHDITVFVRLAVGREYPKSKKKKRKKETRRSVTFLQLMDTRLAHHHACTLTYSAAIGCTGLVISFLPETPLSNCNGIINLQARSDYAIPQTKPGDNVIALVSLVL